MHVAYGKGKLASNTTHMSPQVLKQLMEEEEEKVYRFWSANKIDHLWWTLCRHQSSHGKLLGSYTPGVRGTLDVLVMFDVRICFCVCKAQGC